MSKENHLWEVASAEYQLTQKHHLALAGKTARNKKLRWMGETLHAFRNEMAQWRYTPQMTIPDIEIAWIIHSHIVWKGVNASPTDLFYELAETDPAQIIAAEMEGPETLSPLPTEVIRILHNLLLQLEKFGCDIRHEEFSKNWVCPSRGASKGKNGMPKGIAPLAKTETKASPKPKPTPKGAKPKESKKKKLLADYFDLGDKR